MQPFSEQSVLSVFFEDTPAGVPPSRYRQRRGNEPAQVLMLYYVLSFARHVLRLRATHPGLTEASKSKSSASSSSSSSSSYSTPSLAAITDMQIMERIGT